MNPFFITSTPARQFWEFFGNIETLVGTVANPFLRPSYYTATVATQVGKVRTG